MEIDVTADRDKYIGGSDVPVIMGISSFKTRWALLLEKACIEKTDFPGNRYTAYGKIMEPQIRDYINELYFTDFEPAQKIAGDLRGNADGFNGIALLEIKTTSHIYKTADDYREYLVQLLFYMHLYGVSDGILAVYERPVDFDELFDPCRLQIFEISAEDYAGLILQIDNEVDRFRADLTRLRQNPLLCEEDFQPNELITLSNKLLAFERRLAVYKELEKQYEDMKQQLFNAMQKHNVTSWETFGGAKITLVEETSATVENVQELDIEALSKAHPDIVREYTKAVEKKKKGRRGYIRITLPKEG